MNDKINFELTKNMKLSIFTIKGPIKTKSVRKKYKVTLELAYTLLKQLKEVERNTSKGGKKTLIKMPKSVRDPKNPSYFSTYHQRSLRCLPTINPR